MTQSKLIIVMNVLLGLSMHCCKAVFFNLRAVATLVLQASSTVHFLSLYVQTMAYDKCKPLQLSFLFFNMQAMGDIMFKLEVCIIMHCCHKHSHMTLAMHDTFTIVLHHLGYVRCNYHSALRWYHIFPCKVTMSTGIHVKELAHLHSTIPATCQCIKKTL